ncbi:MAG: hypothetical protein OXP37_09510 [Chloroflexota bacterium]|nr:hypothetical protein [Chloroflexota bacterium]
MNLGATLRKQLRWAWGSGSGGTAFLLMASVANGLQFIYQVSMARLLQPDQYTQLLALVSFVTILLFPGHAFQSAVAVGAGALAAARQRAAVWSFALRANAVGAGTALAVSILLALLSEQLREVFGFESNWVLVPLLCILPLSLVLATARGAVQGMARFIALGINLLVDASARVLLAIGLVVAGFGLTGALSGFSLGIVAGIGLGIWVLRPRGGDQAPANPNLGALLLTQLGTVPATFAIFGAQSVDVIIANWRFPGAGLEPFVAAAFAGRISFYGCFTVGQLLLPRFRDMFGEGRLDRNLLLRGSLAAAAIAAGPLLAALVAPGFLHLALVGPNYAADAGLLQVYLGGATLLSIALYLVYMLIAAGVRWIAWVLAPAAALQTAGYLFVAESAYDLAVILLASAGLMCIACAIAAATLLRERAALAAKMRS